MEGFPTDLVELMDELSSREFLKLALYKLNKLHIDSYEELQELDKVLRKIVDISTTVKLQMLSPALRELFFKTLSEKGLDKPPSLLLDCANTYELQKQPIPSQKISKPLTSFPDDKQPTLFQNTSNAETTAFPNASKQSDTQNALFQSIMKQLDAGPSLQVGSPRPQDSKPFNKRTSTLQNVLDSYETEPFEKELAQPKPGTQLKEAVSRIQRRQYRQKSESPPAAYRDRSSPRPRSDLQSKPPSSRRSRSPPSYRKRSSSRPRPDLRPISESSRRSRSPPSSYSSRTLSRPRVDSQGKHTLQEMFSKDEANDTKRDDANSQRSGLSFRLAPRRKYPALDRPPVKF